MYLLVQTSIPYSLSFTLYVASTHFIKINLSLPLSLTRSHTFTPSNTTTLTLTNANTIKNSHLGRYKRRAKVQQTLKRRPESFSNTQTPLSLSHVQSSSLARKGLTLSLAVRFHRHQLVSLSLALIRAERASLFRSLVQNGPAYTHMNGGKAKERTKWCFVGVCVLGSANSEWKRERERERER